MSDVELFEADVASFPTLRFEPPRFRVGQRVQCSLETENVEEEIWEVGRVELIWPNEDTPYNVRLDRGDRVVVPVDEDSCIRSCSRNGEDKFKLRFDVGDRVECQMGERTWAKGTVDKLYYREPYWPENRYVPYDVRLDSGDLVMAPTDVDPTIRAIGKKLRFRIGQSVSCRVEGGRKAGRVTQLWPDEGSVYKVLLEDGTYVYAPDDHDSYIKEIYISKQAVSDKRSRKEKKRDRQRKKKAASRGSHGRDTLKDLKLASVSPKKQSPGRSVNEESASSKRSNPLSDRINHSKLLTLVFEEATELFKQRRQRLNNLALKKSLPKEKIAKANYSALKSVDHGCFSEVGGKTGKTFFSVVVGHEEYLYRTSKSLKNTNIAPRTIIDLHGCSREEALSRLSKALPGWMEDAMKDFPWTLPVDIIVGGGSQLVSEAVEHWIREERQIAKRFA